MQYALFIFLSLLAEILGTVGGFGSSVFFVPIAGYFLDFRMALGLTALFHLISNLSKIGLFRSGLDKKLILQLGIPSVIGVLIGSYITRFFESHFLQLGLSIFLIILSLVFLIFQNLVLKQGKLESITGGTLSGFLAGFLGTGGAVRGLTMAAFNLPKNTFIATSASIDMAVDLTRSVVYFSNGYIDKSLLIYLPGLLVVGIVGSWIGKKLLHFLPQEKFRNLSLWLILIVGVIMLTKFFEFE